jgi:hypothetical protein
VKKTTKLYDSFNYAWKQRRKKEFKGPLEAEPNKEAEMVLGSRAR